MITGITCPAGWAVCAPSSLYKYPDLSGPGMLSSLFQAILLNFQIDSITSNKIARNHIIGRSCAPIIGRSCAPYYRKELCTPFCTLFTPCRGREHVSCARHQQCLALPKLRIVKVLHCQSFTLLMLRITNSQSFHDSALSIRLIFKFTEYLTTNFRSAIITKTHLLALVAGECYQCFHFILTVLNCIFSTINP